MTDTIDDDEAAPPPPPGRGRRTLPVGPVGLLVITAVAIAAAFLAGRLVIDALDDDPPSPQEVLDAAVPAPLVPDTEARAEVGEPAPNVRLEYLDGGSAQLAEVAGVGTPVVVNFWSSTCIPCLAEMPAFEEVHDRLGDEVAFLGIDVADTVEDGREMVERTGVTYPNARDPRSEIFTVFGGIALPRTVLIAADGTVADTHSGELDAEELTELLRSNGLIDP